MPREFLGALMTPRGPIGREQAGSPAVNRTGFLGVVLLKFSSSGYPHGAPTPGSATYQGRYPPSSIRRTVPPGHHSYSSGPPGRLHMPAWEFPIAVIPLARQRVRAAPGPDPPGLSR